MTILVDSNVVLDIVTNNPEWYEWSLKHLEDLSLRHELAINDIVYAELSPSFERFEELEAEVRQMGFELRPMPRPALFLASRVFQTYRRRGGKKTNVLPDFFIGAHASVEAMPLLTRDVARYRTYFPQLELISP